MLLYKLVVLTFSHWVVFTACYLKFSRLSTLELLYCSKNQESLSKHCLRKNYLMLLNQKVLTIYLSIFSVIIVITDDVPSEIWILHNSIKIINAFLVINGNLPLLNIFLFIILCKDFNFDCLHNKSLCLNFPLLIFIADISYSVCCQRFYWKINDLIIFLRCLWLFTVRTILEGRIRLISGKHLLIKKLNIIFSTYNFPPIK